MVASLDELEAMHRKLAHYEEREKVRSDTLAGETHAERMMAALNVMADAFSYYDHDDRLVLYNEAFVDLYHGLADLIRPGVSYEALKQAGMQRALWEFDDDAAPGSKRRRASTVPNRNGSRRSGPVTAAGSCIARCAPMTAG